MLEPISPSALRAIDAPTTWSSAPRPASGSTSKFANRQHKPYQPRGHAMSGAGGNHVASAVHPASTNPSRYWIGTYYPTFTEQADYVINATIPELRMATDTGDITCFRGQWEMGGRGDKEGKLHAQFAVCFAAKCRAPQARAILGGQWGRFEGWLDVARSNAVWDYVKKPETRVADIPDWGELTDNSGERTDLDFIYEKIAAGAPIYEIMELYPRQFMRNHAAISKLCSYYDRPREYGPIHVEIWWGVTGSGKSHKAFTEYPDAYRKSIPGRWFEGYKGEKTVIFEEFNPEEDKELRMPELLKIFDKYTYQV
nr:MAG: rep protein [Cressdnaviricota sp.]